MTNETYRFGDADAPATGSQAFEHAVNGVVNLLVQTVENINGLVWR